MYQWMQLQGGHPLAAMNPQVILILVIIILSTINSTLPVPQHASTNQTTNLPTTSNHPFTLAQHQTEKRKKKEKGRHHPVTSPRRLRWWAGYVPFVGRCLLPCTCCLVSRQTMEVHQYWGIMCMPWCTATRCIIGHTSRIPPSSHTHHLTHLLTHQITSTIHFTISPTHPPTHPVAHPLITHKVHHPNHWRWQGAYPGQPYSASEFKDRLLQDTLTRSLPSGSLTGKGGSSDGSGGDSGAPISYEWSITVPNLLARTQYQFQIAPYNRVGNGTRSYATSPPVLTGALADPLAR